MPTQKMNKFEAILYELFYTLSPKEISEILESMDFEETGVSKQWVINWWENCQKESEKETKLARNSRKKEVRVLDWGLSKTAE